MEANTTPLMPPVPAQFDLVVLLNKALFAHAAVESHKATLAAEEKKLTEAVVALETAMMTANVRNLGSTMGTADIVDKIVYNAEDWNALHGHIERTGEFDLLHRRINQTAARDRESNGELPPGMRKVVLAQTKLTLL